MNARFFGPVNFFAASFSVDFTVSSISTATRIYESHNAILFTIINGTLFLSASLRAKNWYFEALLDVGKTPTAKRGFESIQLRAREGTRIHLEATAFLGICALRLGDVEKAKEAIRHVVSNTNNIKSDGRRQQFELRLMKRIEDEYILSQLIGQNRGVLVPEEIHKQSIIYVQKSDDEILELIGSCLPERTGFVLKDITNYSIGLLPPQDQKLLTAYRNQVPKRELGGKTFTALKRISWRTFCDESSEIYGLWSNKIPKVFGQGYFALAFTSALSEWKIGIPQLAVGVVATVMKYSCKEFCESCKPEGLMIPVGKKK